MHVCAHMYTHHSSVDSSKVTGLYLPSVKPCEFKLFEESGLGMDYTFSGWIGSEESHKFAVTSPSILKGGGLVEWID